MAANYYALTRNPVVGPGSDNLTNPPNLVSGALTTGSTQYRFVQLTYSAVQSLAATGLSGDIIFLPDPQWVTVQVYVQTTATYSIEGTCAPASIISANPTVSGGTVAWTAVSTALTGATTSQIAAINGFTAIRINITSYGSGNVVLSVRA